MRRPQAHEPRGGNGRDGRGKPLEKSTGRGALPAQNGRGSGVEAHGQRVRDTEDGRRVRRGCLYARGARERLPARMTEDGEGKGCGETPTWSEARRAVCSIRIGRDQVLRIPWRARTCSV